MDILMAGHEKAAGMQCNTFEANAQLSPAQLKNSRTEVHPRLLQPLTDLLN